MSTYTRCSRVLLIDVVFMRSFTEKVEGKDGLKGYVRNLQLALLVTDCSVLTMLHCISAVLEITDSLKT